MYDNNFTISDRYKNSTRAFIESVSKDYADRNDRHDDRMSTVPYQEEAKMVMENVFMHDAKKNRYNSFSETVRNSLVVESLYRIYNEAVSEDIKEDPSNVTVMRGIINHYVNENGYTRVLDNMKKASVFMSNMYNTISRCTKSFLESVDKDNPDTFRITPEMKDEFYNQLDYSNSEEISKAIAERNSEAIKDFVRANAKDHDSIEEALKKAQEKIDSIPEEDTALKEYYEMKGRRVISEISNAPKSLFHALVYALSESIMKNENMKAEFFTEGHINMDKVVDRASLMYTFLEMLNTTRLEKIDESYLKSMLESFSK